ncbi:MAG TPA: hypothetical protein VFH33_00295, partial [Candidatus Krumholzibacteria bacterium]|nr:hypothetical protein [Candidatus Krumholzibacteria bacterium]
ASVRRLLARCLERDPKQRLRDIGEARIVLYAPGGVESRAVAGPQTTKARRAWLPWFVAAVAAVAAFVATFMSSRHDAMPTAPVKYLQRTYATQTIFQALYGPDGETVIFSASPGGTTPHLYALRPEYTEPQKVSDDPLHLLSISSKGELAVLTNPKWIAHRMFTGTLARMPIGGGAPREITENIVQAVWDPAGNELALSRSVDAVWRLEYPPGKVLYQTGAYISDLRFSPDGKHIAYFEHPFKFDDRGGIAVVDLEGHRKLLADDYWGEEGIAWSADGSTVYYSAGTGYSDFSIYAVTLDGKVRVAAQSAGGLVIHDVAPSGKWIATRDDLTRVMIGRAPGSTTERDISWQDLSFPNDISDDGRVVLFTESGTTSGNNYQACIRGTDGSGVIVLGEGAAIDLTADGKWAIAGISPNRVLVYPTGAGKTIELKTSSIAHVSDAHWVVDGKQVVLLGGPEGEADRCYLMDIDGDTPKPIGEQGIFAVSPLPGGQKILMVDSNFKMWVVPVDGSAPFDLGRTASPDEGSAGWNRDGTSAAVFTRLNIPCTVDEIELISGKRRPLFSITPPVSPTLYVSQVLVTPDRSAYTYDAVTYLSRLYTLEGAH